VPEAGGVTSGSAQETGPRGVALPVALVIGVSALVYLPGLNAGFVGDDFMILHRLRALTGAGDVWRFFQTEFFEYYRPLGFVAHAVDYGLAGAAPRQFHLTNLLLHSCNAVFVLLIGRRLSPGTLAGPLSALLFALHASNHEAVMWISARFDLLATTFSLTAVWWMTRERAGAVAPALLFACALLSKEAAVALPLAAAGWLVFHEHASTREAARRVAPWAGALVVYAILRQLGGGVSAVGGSGRLPKLIVFGAALACILVLADGRWMTLKSALQKARGRIALIAAVLLASAGTAAAASSGAIGRFAAEKLSVAGFALFHLLSPVADPPGIPFYLDTSTPLYWAGGLVLLGATTAALLIGWRPLLQDRRMWFLATFLIATLLPISALTEGKRYLYLPSAAFSLLAGVLLAELTGGRGRAAMLGVALFLAGSSFDVSRKVRDWKWAGRMTAEGAALVDAAIAPACGSGDVVFLTSPVSMRNVYTHFYYETFEIPRGCIPERFHVLTRVVRIDSAPDVRWEGTGRIVIAVDPYDGNFVLSSDLRHFDRSLGRDAREILVTPLGTLRSAPYGTAGVRLTLTLSEDVLAAPPLFFYYSGGRIHRLPAPD